MNAEINNQYIKTSNGDVINSKNKYDIYELQSSFDYSKYIDEKDVSSYFYHKLPEKGEGHIIEKHPEIENKIPNYLDVACEAIKMPDYVMRGNAKNHVVILKKLPTKRNSNGDEIENGIVVVFEMKKEENIIKTMRYTSKKDLYRLIRKMNQK